MSAGSKVGERGKGSALFEKNLGCSGRDFKSRTARPAVNSRALSLGAHGSPHVDRLLFILSWVGLAGGVASLTALYKQTGCVLALNRMSYNRTATNGECVPWPTGLISSPGRMSAILAITFHPGFRCNTLLNLSTMAVPTELEAWFSFASIPRIIFTAFIRVRSDEHLDIHQRTWQSEEETEPQPTSKILHVRTNTLHFNFRANTTEDSNKERLPLQQFAEG
uniref:Uncharacterized protein n=1 Tax=Timema cristinae TaxID=61476 RepID=A0A7R9D9Q4_TIMCR|nr:unnamed protein product [Timema cristinae]